MTAPNSQAFSQTDSKLDEALKRLQHDLDPASGRAGPPSPRPPAQPVAAPPPPTWGPSHPRALSPLSMLVEVARHAHVLKRQVEDLLNGLTGEVSPLRSREEPILPSSLLPAVAQLAHEIERTHSEIGQLVAHLRGRL